MQPKLTETDCVLTAHRHFPHVINIFIKVLLFATMGNQFK